MRLLQHYAVMKLSALLLIYLIGVEAKGKRPSGSSAEKHRPNEGPRALSGADGLKQPIRNPKDVNHGNPVLHPPKYGHYGLKPGSGRGVVNGAKSGYTPEEAVEQSNSMPDNLEVLPEPEGASLEAIKKLDKWGQKEEHFSESFSGKSGLAGASLGQGQYSYYGDGDGKDVLLGAEFGQSNVHLGSGQTADQSGLLGTEFGQSNVQGQYLGSGQAADQSGLLGTEFGLSDVQEQYLGLGQAAGPSGLLGNYGQNNIQGGYQSLGQPGGQGWLRGSLAGQSIIRGQYATPTGISGLGLGIGGSAQLLHPGVRRREIVRIFRHPGRYYGRVPLQLDGRFGFWNGQGNIQAQQQGFALPAVGYGTAAGESEQEAYSGSYAEQATAYNNYGGVNAQGQSEVPWIGSTVQGPYSGVANPMGYFGTGGLGLKGQSGPASLGQNLCPMGYTNLAGRCVLATGLIAGYGGAEKAGVVSSAEFTGEGGGAFHKPAVPFLGRNVVPGFYYPPPQHLNANPNM